MASRAQVERRTVFYVLGKLLCFWLFRIGWRVTYLGLHHIPRRGAVIIASNHRSFVDPPLVGTGIPRVAHFLAKKELFHFKPFGWLLHQLNSHPLNRAHGIGALRAAQEILEEGGVVVLFPEGKRNKTKDLLRPKLGVGLLALKTRSMVIPTYVHNSDRLFEGKRLKVVYGPPIDGHHYQSYESLAHAVMEGIQKLKDQLDQKI